MGVTCLLLLGPFYYIQTNFSILFCTRLYLAKGGHSVRFIFTKKTDNDIIIYFLADYKKEHDLLIPFHNGLLIIWVCKKKLSTSLLYWVIVDFQCYQICWQLQSGDTDNQLSPIIRVTWKAFFYTLRLLVNHLLNWLN